MPTPNEKPQSCENPMHGDPLKDLQLELEIQAFAELLLDIYEYRYWKKRTPADSSSRLDDHLKERKMK